VAPNDAEREVPLPGGNANRDLVMRVGDTVRRPLRPTSTATHALLEHLEAAGFTGAPRFLGIDRSGREVLTYIRGDVPLPPYPDWALTDEALASVARLLDSLLAAVADFNPNPHSWARDVPDEFRTELVTHNDPKPENFVFRDGAAVALLDFDLAAPGSRLWEAATAARHWVPLRHEDDIHDRRRGRAADRLRLFLDNFHLQETDRARFGHAVKLSHDWGYHDVLEGVVGGHPGFTHYWEQVHNRARRTRRWYDQHEQALTNMALTQPT